MIDLSAWRSGNFQLCSDFRLAYVKNADLQSVGVAKSIMWITSKKSHPAWVEVQTRGDFVNQSKIVQQHIGFSQTSWTSTPISNETDNQRLRTPTVLVFHWRNRQLQRTSMMGSVFRNSRQSTEHTTSFFHLTTREDCEDLQSWELLQKSYP